MIISKRANAQIEDFVALMHSVDDALNKDAKSRPQHYRTHSGTLLEKDVYDAIVENSIDTPFAGTVELVSGASFPDIVANKFFGVEVKSTQSNSWKSIGSSILESTRVESVEKIFLTFGKLNKSVEFLTRPYEECLSDIVVTHHPRYQIDMELKKGETIFDKLKHPYDSFRVAKDQISIISAYYKKKLKEGQSLWWAKENQGQGQPVVIRLWNTLSPDEQLSLKLEGFVRFPELLKSHGQYERFVLWLIRTHSVVCPNVRDLFSAGGKKEIGRYGRVSAAVSRLCNHQDKIKKIILSEPEYILHECWKEPPQSGERRIEKWCDLVANALGENVEKEKELLYDTFL